MQIVADSKIVLKEIYNLLQEDSYTLVVHIHMESVATKLNISTKHLNLCIHYLIECGYLKGDFPYNNSKDAIKDVFVLPSAINKIECASI